MSINSEIKEIDAVVNRIMDSLSGTISSKSGRIGIALRYDIGDIRANFQQMLIDGVFSAKLLSCFTDAKASGASLLQFIPVHTQLFAETPVGNVSKAIVQMATVYCMAAEARIASEITFTSRNDVEEMMTKMTAIFNTARDLAADVEDSSSYQALTALAGALTDHLANDARPLPRMVSFSLPIAMSALAASQLVYYVGDRWEELFAENKTIHPLFMQRDIVGLAS